MAALSRKPSNLPLSISTTTNPNMPTFFESASNKLTKKKKSFSPFDKIKNVFSMRTKHLESEDLRGSGGNIPLIVTPTEEPLKKIGDFKAMSYSAENVFNSDAKKSDATLKIQLPPNTQRAASNDCLKLKEEKIGNLLRSSECLISKPDFEVISMSLPRNLNKNNGRCTITFNEEISDKSHFKQERIVQEKSEESTTSFCEMDLNEVLKGEDDLDHRAAHHRKDLKPKGRRPPTIYQQFKLRTNHDSSIRKTFLSPPHRISPNFNPNSSDNLAITSEAQEEQKTTETTQTSIGDNLTTALQHLKRKSYAPQLDKIRRKTIANYQLCDMQINDEVIKENAATASRSPELKVTPPKPQRNASFKFVREESESAKVVEVPKIKKTRVTKTMSLHNSELEKLHNSELEKLHNSRETINEVDFTSRRNQFLQMKVAGLPGKDVLDISKSFGTNKPEDKDLNKRPQNKFLQVSSPINISGDFKNLKVNHEEQKVKGSPESITEVHKIESTPVEDASPTKSDKFSQPKKLDDKSIFNGQMNKIPEPAFKKFYKPVPTAISEISCSESQVSSKNFITKIETQSSSKPEARDDNATESFESARQKFGPKIIKTQLIKTGDELNAEANQQPVRYSSAYSKKQNEDNRFSIQKPDNLNNLTCSSAQANPFFPKKIENKLPLQVAKQIPPEPFKVSTNESSKIPGTDKGISSIKTTIKLKDVDSDVPPRVSSLKLSKENSSDTKEVKQTDKPMTRAASGINSKMIPNKLNFNPDDWMAKRREKLENPS